jgi:hypothetical protein
MTDLIHPRILLRVGAVLLCLTVLFAARWWDSDGAPSRIAGTLERIEYVSSSRNPPTPLVLLTVGSSCFGLEQAQAPGIFKYRGQELQIETYRRPLLAFPDCMAVSAIIAPDRIYQVDFQSAAMNRALAFIALFLTLLTFAVSFYRCWRSGKRPAYDTNR